MECPLCKRKNTFYNKVIEETNNFLIMPALGSLVRGYILVVPKKHCLTMQNFNDDMQKEYEKLLEKYRELFKKIYGIYPIIFEHGSPDVDGVHAKSIIHAHSHIVNYQFKDEELLINKLHLEKFNGYQDRNYIYYRNHKNQEYISYDFEPISQLFRKLIAIDMGIPDQYDWHLYPFEDNIKMTIDDLNKLKR